MIHRLWMKDHTRRQSNSMLSEVLALIADYILPKLKTQSPLAPAHSSSSKDIFGYSTGRNRRILRDIRRLIFMNCTFANNKIQHKNSLFSINKNSSFSQ